jgi:hypothetical protein
MLGFEPLCLSAQSVISLSVKTLLKHVVFMLLFTQSVISLRLKTLMARTLLETAVFVELPLESCVAVVLGPFFGAFCLCLHCSCEQGASLA